MRRTLRASQSRDCTATTVRRLPSGSFRKVWDRVRDKWGWPDEIETGDPHRGAKLVCFVLALMEYEREPNVFYPSSTISNYVWALCAFMQQLMHADPRTNVVGWRFFMASVVVMCFVPYEPRRRVPTAAIRSALAAVDVSNFAMVQMAVLVLFLYSNVCGTLYYIVMPHAGRAPSNSMHISITCARALGPIL